MDMRRSRERMVREQIEARGISSPAVLAAMAKVPRHLFVQEALHAQAYADFRNRRNGKIYFSTDFRCRCPPI